ncbi:MAG: hypothetical protein WBC44_19310 [Planctomycetaceae bacterium]
MHRLTVRLLTIPLWLGVATLFTLTSPCGCATAQAPAAEKEPVRIPASDSRSLRDHVGEIVTVYGHVARTGKSDSGINFLNFASAEITAVCLADDASKFKEGEPADVFRDADVEITAKVELYRGKLQVKLDGPKSIRRIEAEKKEIPKVELKKVGKDHWLSPAGLHYQGRDPDGRTRLDHVLRHAKDDPERDGPHGVFDDGRDGALTTIDAAWRLIQKHDIEPDVEGDRAAYTVSLGRKVGYLGGSVGADRKNPPLTRVFIVVERGTSRVVTAYPK